MRTLTWACMIVVVAASPVAAEPIIFRFTVALDPGFGGVDLVGLRFSEGDVITGRFTLDPSEPDEQFTDPTFGFYDIPLLEWSAPEAKFVGERPRVAIVNSESRESVIVLAVRPSVVSSVRFIDNTNSSLLSSDVIPTDPELLMRFPEREWFVGEDRAEMQGLGTHAFGTITSLSVESGAAVPEPSTLLLLGIGAVGTMARARRHRAWSSRAGSPDALRAASKANSGA